MVYRPDVPPRTSAKGRYRQFNQLGVEVFGLQGPDIDAELIMLTARWWRALGISEHVSTELNSIGSLEARANYRDALVAFPNNTKRSSTKTVSVVCTATAARTDSKILTYRRC